MILVGKLRAVLIYVTGKSGLGILSDVVGIVAYLILGIPDGSKAVLSGLRICSGNRCHTVDRHILALSVLLIQTECEA